MERREKDRQGEKERLKEKRKSEKKRDRGDEFTFWMERKSLLSFILGLQT